MKVKYTPENGDPKEFDYNPNKLMSAEREAIETRLGLSFKAFADGVLNGNSRCRRVLLYTLQKREHPTISYDDVDFAMDELKVEMTKGEIEIAVAQMREKNGDERLIEGMLRELPTAPEDPEGGKARLPFVV